MTTSKRKVLVVGNGSLFGYGMGTLLGGKNSGLVVERASTIDAAVETVSKFRPDVIIFCIERDELRNGKDSENALRRLRLMEAYPTRIIRCTLDNNNLTIYDTKRITDATAEDLLAAVCCAEDDSCEK